jgi:hypothetical protein
MTLVFPQSCAADRCPFRVVESSEVRIRELSLRAAQWAQPTFRELELRSHQRFPYSRLIALTALNSQTGFTPEQSSYVVGKHLSPLGLDFFHHAPIPQRFAIISLELAAEQFVHLLMKITWCRFLRGNWYDSGGRFLKLVEWTADDTQTACAPSSLATGTDMN